MELNDAKRVSMVILLFSNVIMTLVGICLQKFLLQRNGNALSITQRIISCLTSGILLGTLLILIFPNSLDAVSHDWHNKSIGYILIGLGFFLICIIDESIKLYDLYLSNKRNQTEKEQLLNPSIESNHDHHLTSLITLVFALGVHYFFSGILIGGQTDEAKVWLLLAAICVHMSLVAFSITLRLLIDNKNYIEVFMAMLIWSLMGPFGVLISMFVNSYSSTFSLVNGILQCVSAGTFIYITFIHMIHDDLLKTKIYPFVNIILIFIGFIIIVLTSLLHEHSL